MKNPLVLPESFQIRASLLGEHILTRGLFTDSRISSHPLVVPLRENVPVVIFRYGAIVIINGDEEDSGRVRDLLGDRIVRPVAPESSRFSEEVTAKISGDGLDSSDDGLVLLKDTAVPRLQLIAEMLARSVLLAFYESHIRDAFDEVEPVARGLVSLGPSVIKPRPLTKQLGISLLVEHHLVGRVEVTERPDVLWEHAELDRLFLQLEEEFELTERASALQRKVDLIARTNGTIVNLMHNQRSLRLEWWIVILIMIEILFTVIEHASAILQVSAS